MTYYKVSVGVPVYNAAKYIERCAKSILSQSYENLEVVFVDDCSTDDSVNIIENTLNYYPHRKEQVRIIRHNKNQGVSVARNTLLSAFTGEFFSFVDADDYLLLDAVEVLVNKQIEDDSDMVSGSMLLKYSDHSDLIEEPMYNGIDDMLYHIIGQPNNHSNSGRIYRTSLIVDKEIKNISGINIGEDWLFLVNIILNIKKMSRIDKVVYVYDFTNEESAMHQLFKKENQCQHVLNDLEVLYLIKKAIFFKGSNFVNRIEKLMASRLEGGLFHAVLTHDRRMFSHIRCYVQDINSNNINDSFVFKKLNKWGVLNFDSYRFYKWIERCKYFHLLQKIKRTFCK